MNPLRTAAPTAAASHALSPWPAPVAHARSLPSHITAYAPSRRFAGPPHTPPATIALPVSPVVPSSGLGSTGPWSSRDDEILLAARAQNQGWNQIQRDHFPSKSANACRKRYERLNAKRRGAADWNDERIDRLANSYMLMREQTWRPLADAVGENWEDVEKMPDDEDDSGGASLLPPVLSEADPTAAAPPLGVGSGKDNPPEEELVTNDDDDDASNLGAEGEAVSTAPTTTSDGRPTAVEEEARIVGASFG
ncbi:hypothetical protein LOZ51_001709 [Ophidiomyces ophidiicola]|nr:hypothetical protein LOZ55_005102 [Ophidiomyces ophidiicola]KAI1985499.1 hypothetical protein LOZ54_004173 [Ophidiomyces ophidiicola]KAI1999223.1 hypothetical protein LOZ51_001709 [Ophidiomyces ophidiicola]